MSSLEDLGVIMSHCLMEWMTREGLATGGRVLVTEQEMKQLARAFSAGFIYGGLRLTREEISGKEP